jgi:translation initiation factor IF-2
VKEVPSGVECGIAAEGFRDWAEGDVVEAYDLVEKKLKLEEAHAATISI